MDRRLEKRLGRIRASLAFLHANESTMDAIALRKYKSNLSQKVSKLRKKWPTDELPVELRRQRRTGFASAAERHKVRNQQKRDSDAREVKRPYRRKADKEAAKFLAEFSTAAPPGSANRNVAAASMGAASHTTTTTAHATTATGNPVVAAASTATQTPNPIVVAASTQTEHNVATCHNTGGTQVEGPTLSSLTELARLEGHGVLEVFSPDAIESLKHGFLHDQSIDVVVQLLKSQIRRCKEARQMKPSEFSTQIECLTEFEFKLERFLGEHSDTIDNVVSGKWKKEKGDLLRLCRLLYDNIGKTMEGSTKLFLRRGDDGRGDDGPKQLRCHVVCSRDNGQWMVPSRLVETLTNATGNVIQRGFRGGSTDGKKVVQMLQEHNTMCYSLWAQSLSPESMQPASSGSTRSETSTASTRQQRASTRQKRANSASTRHGTSDVVEEAVQWLEGSAIVTRAHLDPPYQNVKVFVLSYIVSDKPTGYDGAGIGPWLLEVVEKDLEKRGAQMLIVHGANTDFYKSKSTNKNGQYMIVPEALMTCPFVAKDRETNYFYKEFGGFSLEVEKSSNVPIRVTLDSEAEKNEYAETGEE